MNNPADWNPDLYLKFGNERTRPSIDLVSRIMVENPRRIIDIGCGPGNSTQVLARRWPGSRVTGLDNSASMIEKARNDYPDMEWVLGDALSIPAGERYDIVFSNAAIQWIPDHGSLIPMLFGLVAKGGALAVQAPKFRDMPMGRIVGSVADRKRWKERTAGCEALFTYNEYGFYYDLLAPTARAMDMWETWYIHVMDSHRGVLDWIRSTALKPYLDRLDGGGEKQAFEDEILEEIEKAYPRQKKGKVLFPFKRLFFIAYT